jgi:F plasmid transfer operon, TraF, protein
MNFVPHRIALAVALALPALAQATPFSIFEARGFAMGGAGVAASEYAAASLYNPALLAAPSDSNRFSFIFPALGARVSGSDGAVTAVQDFNDNKSIDKMTAAADAFSAVYDACQANPGSCNTSDLQAKSGQLASATGLLKTDLLALNGKTYNVNAGGVMAMAFPKWEYKGALSLNVEFFGRATPIIDSADLVDVDTVINGLQTYANSGNINDLNTVVDGNGDVKVGSNNDDYQSKFKVIGVAVADFGISLAKPFVIAEETVLVGITPKIQQVRTVAYTANVDNTDFDLNENSKTGTGFNVDVGLAKTFEAGRFENVRLGLVVRNLIPHTYKTADATQDVKLSPQVRIGAAWSGKWGTITSDLDLTANKIVGSGSDASQVFALGGELNAWNVAKLRLGFRNDIKAKYSAVTAGVSLLGVQLSGAYSQDREVAALLQFGASF